MSTYEPNNAEVRSTLFLGTLIAPFYSGYIQRLPLSGCERVLDYGSGSGVCSKHLAARLMKNGGRLTCVDVSRTWNRVIRETIKNYSNVETCVADLTVETEARQLPDAGFDAVFIHFVLHDIPQPERPVIVRQLARKLAAGGQVFLREPEEPGGMQADEARRLLADAGLREVSFRRETRWYTGPMYEAVYCKG